MDYQNLQQIGEGKTAKIYRDGDRAFKVYNSDYATFAEHEAKMQTYAYNVGLPVPAVYGVSQAGDGRVVFEMEYVSGRPIFYPGIPREDRNGAIETLVRLQHEVHALKSDELPCQADMLEYRIINNPVVKEPHVKDGMLALLTRLDRGENRLCHGDFHALNTLFDGEKNWIIDWGAASSGKPLADACRTYLLFRLYITRYAETYLRTFCKVSGAAKDDVLAWLPIAAAVCLYDGADSRQRTVLEGIIGEWQK
ncbi:aminoglycoside phosphotransferase [Clostridia bacterium]|nr:aminoglycoside phosphotransferase [Clostridia bacterium]GHV31700.1 aminoglycoside phosphotransferase [Clostridia bacterium]